MNKTIGIIFSAFLASATAYASEDVADPAAVDVTDPAESVLPLDEAAPAVEEAVEGTDEAVEGTDEAVDEAVDEATPADEAVEGTDEAVDEETGEEPSLLDQIKDLLPGGEDK